MFAEFNPLVLKFIPLKMSKKIVKLELTNSRFSKADIRDHASEFVSYSRYSGFTLVNYTDDLRNSKLLPIKSDFNELFKLLLETTLDNAKVLYQLTKLYPSFGNWKIKCLTPGVDITNYVSKPTAPEKKKKKKVAAKPVKKVVASVAKGAKKPKASKAAKKKSAAKPANKKASAKKPAKKRR